MPFLRVLRDKRGYETTYLMHWFREGNRQRSRVLYVFRTPGGTRVGRAPLEPEVLREIEARHPEIEFDWDVILEQQQVVEPGPDMRRRRPRRDERPAPTGVEVRAPPPAAETSVAASPVPAALDGATPDEQIAFLERTYPLVKERIASRVIDPVRRDALGALAERLNPAAWTDADQITTGLQQASEALDRLSRVLSRRRRRGRRRAAAAPSSQGDTPADANGAEPEGEPDSEEGQI